METRTSEAASQSQATAAEKGRAGGGGAAAGPGARGRKRGRGARRHESPAPRSGHPFADRAAKLQTPGARSLAGGALAGSSP